MSGLGINLLKVLLPTIIANYSQLASINVLKISLDSRSSLDILSEGGYRLETSCCNKDKRNIKVLHRNHITEVLFKLFIIGMNCLNVFVFPFLAVFLLK